MSLLHVISCPQVSIVTVVRNGMPFFRDTLRSVLNQDFPSIEYIVIDGASSDGSLDVIRAHESAISYWCSEADTGIASAFNKGLKQARGDYVLFLNADDWLADKGAIARIVEAARDQDFPDVIYGDCDLYDRVSGKKKYRASIPYSRYALLRGATLPHPGLLTSRKYFSRHGNFDESYSIAMDFELFLRGVPVCGAFHAPVLVTNVREGGMSTRSRQSALEEIFRALRKNGHLKSRLAEWQLRGYYAVRLMARRCLQSLGLKPASS